ncbi:hypothetical protein HS1genome_1663 [Sulfodiicoccus acidiphilus]|uniref:Uncharacterized protein n=1 Tax=Sulfodiicoccus acidiphilus TaxID=1670455 RepID=A0A348B522_9CREN|nr:hypothetical protein [Sulfodiicoccus acidiphilus]BBD73274.1 hypothetical protein HS1genome_1663 [Sulfodiicoccus acidiphilus]GGT89444.1 hypothetical protein GCM10007116_04110 [Sulfodiicoccus acidiphilus]
MITTGVEAKKKEVPVEFVDLGELPEEYVRSEFPEDWKYIQRVRDSLNHWFL